MNILKNLALGFISSLAAAAVWDWFKNTLSRPTVKATRNM